MSEQPEDSAAAKILMAVALGGYSAELADGDEDEGAELFSAFIDEAFASVE